MRKLEGNLYDADEEQPKSIKIRLNVDTVEMKEKPAGGIGVLRNRLCNEARICEITPEELIDCIQHGRSFTPGVMTGTTGDTWQSQQVICADIDNSDANKNMLENPLTPEAALDVMAQYGIEPYFMYYSFSNKPDWPKFRVVLILDEPITDTQERADVIPRFIGIFNAAVKQCADTAVDDAARIFYGSHEDCIICVPAKTTKTALLHTLPEPPKDEPERPVNAPKQPQIAPNVAQVVTAPRANQGRTMAELEAELRADIQNFDLLGYILQTTTSRIHKSGKTTFLNPCPICGHKDDFQVTGSLYHCHSKSGGTGGTVIDYLMNHDGLDLSAALDKFKFEIMGYNREEWKQAYKDDEALKDIERQNQWYEQMMATDPEFKKWAEEAERDAADILPEQKTKKDATVTNAGTDADGENQPAYNPPYALRYEEAFTQYCQREFVRTSTGILPLDIALHGGLTDELYILGAETGQGKSAFCMQLAQNIAAQGVDVLYFALEMSRKELIARGISAESWKNRNKYGQSVTAGDILYFNYDYVAEDFVRVPYSTYAEATKAWFTTYGAHMMIIENTGEGITAKQIKTITEKHAEATGKNPVVFVDYLQMLAADPEDRAQTDRKTKTDIAVRILKSISVKLHIPVFTVSSIGRQGYGKRITTAAFKESGDLEFTGGVLLGLNLEAQIKDYKNQEEAEKEIKAAINPGHGQPRKMILEVMKFRNGERSNDVRLDYFAEYNYMAPDGEHPLTFTETNRNFDEVGSVSDMLNSKPVVANY